MSKPGKLGSEDGGGKCENCCGENMGIAGTDGGCALFTIFVFTLDTDSEFDGADCVAPGMLVGGNNSFVLSVVPKSEPDVVAIVVPVVVDMIGSFAGTELVSVDEVEKA